MIEGPFGDHTGFYSVADLYPQVHVTAVTMRQRPDLRRRRSSGVRRWRTSTSATRPSGSSCRCSSSRSPEIVDYHMPAEGIFHNLVFVSIEKKYPGQAYKVMNALWGQGLMSLAKVLVVVDKGERAQSAGGLVGGAQQHRSRARRALHDGPGGRARSLEPRVHVRLARWASTRRGSGPRKGSRVTGRR